MVIKIEGMEIPILISRNGFTAWGVDVAGQANLTLIGRAKGSRLIALSGVERIIFDSDPAIDEAGRAPEVGVTSDA
jgi:FdhD protein